jgi:NAD(P)-dependent dehydrogenase (short-subunit alcohol dehydrogenase family)
VNQTDSLEGTTGLGAGSITALAKHDPAHILFSGRNEKSAEALESSIRTASPGVKLTFIRCDISSLASVQECARTITATTDRLDILMLNAGIMAKPPSTSWLIVTQRLPGCQYTQVSSLRACLTVRAF